MVNNIDEQNNKEKDELNLLLDDFIMNGVVEKEKDVVPGLKVRLKVLDTGELLIAEALMDSNTAPADIVARVRAASILSQAIIKINGANIDIKEAGYTENKSKRLRLYKQLLKMPAMVVQKLYEFYIDCVNEQNKKYEDSNKNIEDIKNF